MSRHARRGARRNGAAGFLEILVTVVVMAVGIMGIFRLLSSSHREMAAGRDQVAGAAVAAEMIDRIRIADYDRLEPTDGLRPAGEIPWLAGLAPLAHLADGERFAAVAAGEGYRIVECEVRFRPRGREATGEKASCRFLVVRTPFH